MTNLPRFDPVNAAHAVVECIVFFELASPASEQLLPAISSLSDKLRNEFDRSNTIQQVQFKLGPDAHEMSSAVPAGVELLRHRSDGSREWVLRVSVGVLSLHCLDYTRWSDVWARSYAYLIQVADALPTAMPVSSIGLKVIDRFLFKGQQHEYNAELLFRRGSALLHPKAFTSGSRWHCHTGWFDAADQERGEALNQLNVDSAQGKIRGVDGIVVSIEHNLVVRREAPSDLANYLEGADPVQSPVGRLMNYLHDGNRDALLDLLTQAMADRINLRRKMQ